MNILSHRMFRWLAPVSIATAFVLWSSWFVSRTSFLINGKRYFSLFDDAMISMRYAWNLTHGNGLVWNAGERVEGYTNLLMTLAMSISNFFFDKTSATLSIQIFGIALMLLIAFLSLKISGRVLRHDMGEYKGLAYALITLGVLSYYPLVYWSLVGMETGLLTMLLLVAVLFTLRYIDERRNFLLYLVAVSLGLAFLTRNDSAIFAILVFTYLSLMTIKSKDAFIKSKPLVLAAFIFAIFVFFQVAFRYIYYGQLLPNTYLLKLSGFPTDLRIVNGIGFILPFFRETFFLVFLASLALVSHFGMRRILLLSILVLATLYQIWNGGDPWNYWRIIAPSMPLIIILAIIAIVEIGASFKGIRMTGKIPKPDVMDLKQFYFGRATLIIISALIVLIPANRRFVGEIIGLVKPYTAQANENNVRRALAISDLTTEDATVGVFWAGSIPYYSGRKAIDFLGKSDDYIASLSPDLSGAIAWKGMVGVPGHSKYDLTYSIQKLKPTYIQNVRWGKQDLSQWVESNYIVVNSNDVILFLLADSGQVKWQKITEN